MFPFWSRAAQADVAALLAGAQRQAAEHDAAVARIVELAHADDQLSDAVQLPTWDGPTFGVWNDRSQR